MSELKDKETMKPLIVKLNRGATTEDIDAPLTTVMSGGNHHALCQLVCDHQNNGKADPLDRPLKTQMKLVPLDFGAERRELEIYAPFGKRYYEVECPFCNRRNLVYYRNFARGVRCGNSGCRAMLYYPTHCATRDLMPENETVLVHGLRTSIAVAERETK